MIEVNCKDCNKKIKRRRRTMEKGWTVCNKCGRKRCRSSFSFEGHMQYRREAAKRNLLYT